MAVSKPFYYSLFVNEMKILFAVKIRIITFDKDLKRPNSRVGSRLSFFVTSLPMVMVLITLAFMRNVYEVQKVSIAFYVRHLWL